MLDDVGNSTVGVSIITLLVWLITDCVIYGACDTKVGVDMCMVVSCTKLENTLLEGPVILI